MFDSLNVLPNEYQRARAVIATLNNAAMLANPAYEQTPCFQIADAAIYSAEQLLAKLGIDDPDKRP